MLLVSYLFFIFPVLMNFASWVQSNLPQQTIGVVVNDNLDIACQIVEKAAMEKAVVEVDEGLSQAYAARRKHWEVCLSCEMARLADAEEGFYL